MHLNFFIYKVIGIERNDAFVNEAIKRQEKSFYQSNFFLTFFIRVQHKVLAVATFESFHISFNLINSFAKNSDSNQTKQQNTKLIVAESKQDASNLVQPIAQSPKAQPKQTTSSSNLQHQIDYNLIVTPRPYKKSTSSANMATPVQAPSNQVIQFKLVVLIFLLNALKTPNAFF